MSTQTLDKTDIDPVTGEPQQAHIVRPQGNKTGPAIAMEARVFGNEIEALCGHRWVPSKDPGNYPVCEECKRIFNEETGAEDGWSSS